MKDQLEKTRNDLRETLLEAIKMNKSHIVELEDSIDKYGAKNPVSAEKWRNKVETLKALISQRRERYAELLELSKNES